ncbi:hypothetical protein L3Q82_019718, partial [Scortum barcoo]
IIKYTVVCAYFVFLSQTESLSVSQSAENDTSEIQSSEENTSDQSQSSESDSLESTSEDKTSEESNSQSDEDDQNDSLAETRDDSMGSEENIRKVGHSVCLKLCPALAVLKSLVTARSAYSPHQSWVQEFASVIKVLSAEDNSSTEVKGQSDSVTEKQASTSKSSTAQGNAKLPLVENPADSSDTTSESADTSDSTALTAATSNSSESASSESNETSEASESIEDSDDSNASDSSELAQIKGPACVNGTQSCESEEYFFQDIGDDAHRSVDNLMVPDEDERELFLRR